MVDALVIEAISTSVVRNKLQSGEPSLERFLLYILSVAYRIRLGLRLGANGRFILSPYCEPPYVSNIPAA